MSESDFTDSGKNSNKVSPKMTVTASPYLEKLDKLNSLDYRIP